ncbi:MAG: YjgP/YjgQ family permease, partial [Spirochaetales bacterium]|nr:YjgP/YjgQ family permease [Spirochaetales bacterium]
VPIIEVLKVQLLYIPKCISYSLSPSLLFSIAFTLGGFYSNNELIAVFGSGVSLFRFVLPLLLFGILLSVGGFYFEEEVVIPTYAEKNTLSQDLLKQRKSLSNTNVTTIAAGSRLVYHAEYYNDAARILRTLILIKRDENGRIVERIDAEQAVWKEDVWELQNVRMFSWDGDGFLLETDRTAFTRSDIDEPPDTFRKTIRNIGEMNVQEAREWVDSLKRAGLSYKEPLTEYYKRYSFALTPLVVAFLSCAVGGRFKKNILLMSLLLSLVVSVLYYVSQMISGLLAKSGILTEIVGAWVPFVIFSIIGLWFFKTART